MSGTALALLGSLALLGVNAFFVGAEFSVTSSRRTAVEPLAVAGRRGARTTLQALEHVSLMLATAQLGITVASLGLGALAEPAVAHLLEGPFAAMGLSPTALHTASFVVALLIVSFLHILLGEMVPKNVAIAGPERMALLLAPPLVAITRVLRPIVAFLNALANAGVRLLRVQPRSEVASAFTGEEVGELIAESRREGLIEQESQELAAHALSFEQATVERVMLAPSALVTLGPRASVADVERLCAQTGFSRFPVARPDGSLRGYVHVKDLLDAPAERRGEPIPDRLVRLMPSLEPGEPLQSALQVMRIRGAHVAQVVDRDGTVRGIVMLEDVLEELVGEIRDATRRAAG